MHDLDIWSSVDYFSDNLYCFVYGPGVATYVDLVFKPFLRCVRANLAISLTAPVMVLPLTYPPWPYIMGETLLLQTVHTGQGTE